MPVIPIQPPPDDPRVDQDIFESLRAGFEADRVKREQAAQQQVSITGGVGVAVNVGSDGGYTISRIGGT